jgi:uncharacterized membrane protein
MYMEVDMASVEKSIDVQVPVSTAYNQWTQFESFPHFMEGIEEVKQLDSKRTFWRATIAGKQEEWYADIVEQTPDRRVAWRSTTGAQNAGAVSFQPIDVNTTRVTLTMEYEPEGVVENIGSALGIVDRRVEGDLKRFKEFIESRGTETGAWRGEIHGGKVEHS